MTKDPMKSKLRFCVLAYMMMIKETFKMVQLFSKKIEKMDHLIL